MFIVGAGGWRAGKRAEEAENKLSLEAKRQYHDFACVAYSEIVVVQP